MGEIRTRKDQATIIVDKIEGQREEWTAWLPPSINIDRLKRTVLTSIRGNPALLKCDPRSLLGAVVHLATIGLEPGSAMGLAYLIPFKGQVTPLISFKGLLELARRSGEVLKVEAREACKNDVFEIIAGSNAELVHRVALTDRGAPTHYYAVATLANGTRQFDVMTVAEVEKVRQGSPGRNSMPWRDHFGEMAKKTCVRRLMKMIPSSVSMRKAISVDERYDVGLDTDMRHEVPDWVATEEPQRTRHAFANVPHALNAENDGGGYSDNPMDPGQALDSMPTPEPDYELQHAQEEAS